MLNTTFLISSAVGIYVNISMSSWDKLGEIRPSKLFGIEGLNDVNKPVKNSTKHFPISSLPEIQLPCWFFRKSIAFLPLLIIVERWKNFVFKSVAGSHLVRDFCFHNDPFLISHSWSSKFVLTSFSKFSDVGSSFWIWSSRSHFSLILVWIFLNQSLFHLHKSSFVSLIFLQTLKIGFPLNPFFQAFSTTNKMVSSLVHASTNLKGFLPCPCSPSVFRTIGEWFEDEARTCLTVALGKMNLHLSFANPRSSLSLIFAKPSL